MSSSPIHFSSSNIEERDRELENTIGNLCVAEFQVFRLRNRVADFTKTANAASSYIYKHKDKWYKININVETFDPETENNNKTVELTEPEEHEQVEHTTGFAVNTTSDRADYVQVP